MKEKRESKCVVCGRELEGVLLFCSPECYEKATPEQMGIDDASIVRQFKLIAEKSLKGRAISDRRDLGAGYLGSAKLNDHMMQLLDPRSWVHSSVGDWLTNAEHAEHPDDPEAMAERLRRHNMEMDIEVKEFRAWRNKVVKLMQEIPYPT